MFNAFKHNSKSNQSSIWSFGENNRIRLISSCYICQPLTFHALEEYENIKHPKTWWCTLWKMVMAKNQEHTFLKYPNNTRIFFRGLILYSKCFLLVVVLYVYCIRYTVFYLLNSNNLKLSRNTQKVKWAYMQV